MLPPFTQSCYKTKNVENKLQALQAGRSNILNKLSYNFKYLNIWIVRKSFLTDFANFLLYNISVLFWF